MFSDDTVVASTNGTWLNDGLIDAVLDALDNGPWDFDPKTAMTMAVATPIALIMLCLVIVACRGIPTTSRFSLCTSWKQMPRGTDPDHGIGEHQDELADVDSVDAVDEDHTNRARREYCFKVAAALENGDAYGSGVDTGQCARQAK